MLKKAACLICLLVCCLTSACGPGTVQTKAEEFHVVTDVRGDEVKIPAKPKRIVSVTTGTDEVLLGLVETERMAAVNEGFVLGGNALEAQLLHLAELRYHFLIDLEVLGTVLTRIAEGLSSESPECQPLCHVERRVHENAHGASQLFGIHGSHACGYDDVGLYGRNLLLKERQRLGR